MDWYRDNLIEKHSKALRIFGILAGLFGMIVGGYGILHSNGLLW